VSGYLGAIGAKEIEPLAMVDRAAANAVETREGPEELRRAIWRDDSGAEIWVHSQAGVPHTTTVVFRGSERITAELTGFSPPVDGPMNGLVMLSGLEAPWPSRLVIDLADFADATPRICPGRRVSVGLSGLLTEGRVFKDRATYLAACSRRGDDSDAVSLQPIGLRPQGNSPNATLGGTITDIEERRNSLSGESFLALTVEWEGAELELAAHPTDLQGARPTEGCYLAAKILLVGYDLAYATPVPADPQRFSFAQGSVAAFTGFNGYLQLLQVTRVENLAPGGLVVHMRIFAELFDSMEALQAHQGGYQVAVTHLPLDAGALLDSDVALLGSGPLVDSEETEAAHSAWREAFDRGEAGVFGVPLAQVINWMAQAQAQAEAQPPQEPALSAD
jgi:hypothetical protein